MVAAPAVAAPAPLGGQIMQAGFAPCTWTGGGPPELSTCVDSAPKVTADCDAAGVSTISITRDGFGWGPYGGTSTQTLTVTIGPQTGPAQPEMQPFETSGIRAGTVGFPTGRILALEGTFAFTSYGGTTITGTTTLVDDLANVGVCREYAGTPTHSTLFGPVQLDGYFYMVNAQVLGYEATITTSAGETLEDAGEAETYLSNSFATCAPTPCTNELGTPIVNASTGHLVTGFGSSHPAAGTTTSAPTPAGASVAVTPAPGVDLTFENVTGSGTTTVEALQTVPALPAGIQVGDPPMFYEISTTATFDGAITVCVPSGHGPAGAEPRLLHYEGGAWVDVTISYDALLRIICGSVTSLSPFAAVFGAADTTDPEVTVPNTIVTDATSPVGATVTFAATGLDAGVSVPVTCSPASGSTFAVGTTEVTCTATDAAGNSASNSFDVVVRGAASQLAALSTRVAGIDLGPAAINVQIARAMTDNACQRLATAETLLRSPAARGAQAAGVLADVVRIRAVLGC